MTRYVLFLVAGFLIALSNQVSGQVAVTLSPSSTTVSPSGGTITFTVSIDGNAGDVLTGYDLFVDVVGLDLDNTNRVSITNQNFAAPFDITDATLPIDSRDFGFSAANIFSTPDVSIANQVELFSFDATFSPTSAGQTFQFDLDPGAIGTGLAINGDLVDLTTATFNTAVVTVVLDTQVLLGDCNQDGVVDFLDIGPFIAILSQGPFLEEADVNEDGVIDFLDIGPFIQILSS